MKKFPEFLKLYGKASKKTSIENDLKVKRTVSKELMDELEKRFS